MTKFGKDGAEETQGMVQPSKETTRNFYNLCLQLSRRIFNHGTDSLMEGFKTWKNSEDVDHKVSDHGN